MGGFQLWKLHGRFLAGPRNEVHSSTFHGSSGRVVRGLPHPVYLRGGLKDRRLFWTINVGEWGLRSFHRYKWDACLDFIFDFNIDCTKVTHLIFLSSEFMVVRFEIIFLTMYCSPFSFVLILVVDTCICSSAATFSLRVTQLEIATIPSPHSQLQQVTFF